MIEEKTTFGFWVYMMTDLVLFASLFATYAVLRGNTFGGAGGARLFSLPYVLVETLLLLTSSFTTGLMMIALKNNSLRAVVGWLSATFILGASFLGMELSEFSKLIHEGNSPQRSGFLSAYFTLVGTHGLHIAIGLLWIVVLVILIFYKKLNEATTRKLMLFSIFWHFLDIVWIFIFTIVYLMASK